MESSRFNQRLNSKVQGVVPNQVTHAPLSEDELARVFPGLGITNVETSLFNFINLIHHLWGNHGGAFRANAEIPKPSNKQLILALLNLVNGLSVATADKLLKFCVDENYTEEGINFKKIHDCLLETDYVRNPITSDQFNKYIHNNQKNDGSVATLIESITYSTASARKAGIDKLLRLLAAPSKNVDHLKCFLEMVAEFNFVKNDPIDKESMQKLAQKLAQQLDQHVYKQNDVIVALVDKIQSKISQIKVAAPVVELAAQLQVEVAANQPLIVGDISNRQNPLRIRGNDGKIYTVCTLLNEKKAKIIEKKFGIILKQDLQSKMYHSYLGGGQFSKVYVAEVGGNDFVALKIIKDNNHALIQSSHEASTQKKLLVAAGIDSNLMPILDNVEYHNELGELKLVYIMLPLVALGTVEGISESLKSLKDNSIHNLILLHIADEILLAIFQMHKANFYHLDLKPDNVLIDQEGKVKLSDFGTSEEISANPPELTVSNNSTADRIIRDGARGYFAPERNNISGSKFNPEKADMYAVGAIFWEILTGEKFPYRNNQSAVQNNQDALNHRLLREVQPGTFEALTKQLLDPNPDNRPSAFEARGNRVFNRKTNIYPSEMKIVLRYLRTFVMQQRSNPLTLNPTLAIPFDHRKDILQKLKTYIPLNGALTHYLGLSSNEIYPMNAQIDEFIKDNTQAVLVILGDGGSGKTLFAQWLMSVLLNQRKNTNRFPLYIELGSVKNPEDIFWEQLGLNSEALSQLSSQYQIILIADGFDQMPEKVNLYTANKLHKYNIKLIITTRVTSLSSEDFKIFNPHIANQNYTQVYLQRFTPQQVADYIVNYIKQNKAHLEQQITQNQLTQEYLDPQYVITQLQKIVGLSELMQIPFVSYLTLTNLSKLIGNQSTITNYQAYELIIRKWISTQISNKNISKSIPEVLKFAQKVAFTLTINQMDEIDLSQVNYYIDEKSGAQKRAQNQWDWFRDAKEFRLLLPLELVRPWVYQFMHQSIQEFLVACHLYTQLMKASEFTHLDWNKIDLTSDNSICYGVFSLLVDMVQVDKTFKVKISKLSKQAQIDKSQSIALVNTCLFMHKYSELYLALQDGDVVKVCSIVIRILSDKSLSKNEKIDLLYARDKHGYPGFNWALYKGHDQAVEVFIKEILATDEDVLNKDDKLLLLAAKDKDGYSGFYWALYKGHDQAVEAFIEEILATDEDVLNKDDKLLLLAAKDKDGYSGFYWALYKGHDQAVEVFIKEILATDEMVLSKDYKLSLLAAKDKDGIPGFYYALSNGHDKVVKVFIKAILAADEMILSKDYKLSLLVAKDKDGIPGFYYALSNGHDKVVKVFIKAILAADERILSKTDKLSLLRTEDKDGDSGFYWVLWNGHAEATEVFIKTILAVDEKVLNKEDKLLLLAAKDKAGYQGFCWALWNGHAEVTRAFIKEILAADERMLSKADKLLLLRTESEAGTPGFYWALGNGHAEATEVFIKAILAADESILSKRDKLSLLRAESKAGNLGFYFALQNGHDKAAEVFIKAILAADESTLSKVDKLLLLRAESKAGNPGFYFVLQNGHDKAAEVFIKAILAADENILSKGDKLSLLRAENKAGNPGFCLALYNGHTKAAEVFIKAILAVDEKVLNKDHKLLLLAAKAKNGIPVFGKVFLLGDDKSTTIQIFLELILNTSALDAIDKMALLSDKQLSSAIYNARNQNNVVTFKNIIKKTTKLNQEQKNQILNPLRSLSEKLFVTNN